MYENNFIGEFSSSSKLGGILWGLGVKPTDKYFGSLLKLFTGSFLFLYLGKGHVSVMTAVCAHFLNIPTVKQVSIKQGE